MTCGRGSLDMERAIPILPTDGPEEAKRFYVDALGFSLVSGAHYCQRR